MGAALGVDQEIPANRRGVTDPASPYGNPGGIGGAVENIDALLEADAVLAMGRVVDDAVLGQHGICPDFNEVAVVGRVVDFAVPDPGVIGAQYPHQAIARAALVSLPIDLEPRDPAVIVDQPDRALIPAVNLGRMPGRGR